MREDELIAAVRAQLDDPAGVTGIGDDCAIFSHDGELCVSVDGIVEGRHFAASDAPEAVGRKAAAAALSDLAAMGARPVGALVSLHCPERWDAQVIMTSLRTELQRHDCALLGGDTTAADALVISVTVWGKPAEGGRLLRRSGAAVGDLLVVTGWLGGSLASGRHLRPEPRLLEGLWLAGFDAVSAMMDVSDGLATDGPRLAAANACGSLLLPRSAPIHEDVPQRGDIVRAAMCDGEDYELLFTLRPDAWPELAVQWPFDNLPLTIVGMLCEEPGSWVEDDYGRVMLSPYAGFEHEV